MLSIGSLLWCFLHNHGENLAMALYYAKDNNFSGSTTTLFAFSNSTEIALKNWVEYQGYLLRKGLLLPI